MELASVTIDALQRVRELEKLLKLASSQSKQLIKTLEQIARYMNDESKNLGS